MNVFETLNNINVNDHTEKKGNLTYLSWAWAWQTTKQHFPNANYTVYENDLGFNYHTDGITGWVKVGVTIEIQEHIEYLPIMDFKNKSIPKDSITSIDVNKAIQRALTKAIARHGLGLYIYAGEDLPEIETRPQPKSYNTWSKASDQEKKESKFEFMELCEANGVNREDIKGFFEFLSPGMSESETFNEIVHFLRKPELLTDQLESFVKYQAKQ